MSSRLFVAVVLLCLSIAPPAHADALNDYLRLIASYPTSSAEAARGLAALPRTEITQAITACLTGTASHNAQSEGRRVILITFQCSPRTLMGAAIVHADAAIRLLPTDRELAEFHVQAGRRVLSILLGKRDLRNNGAVHLPALDEIGVPLGVTGLTGEEARFVPRWYALTIRGLLAYYGFQGVRSLLDEAFTAYPDAPELFVINGLFLELPLLRSFPNIRAGADRLESPTGSNVSERARRQLETAAAEYRRALTASPGHVEAKLRVAWIHHLLDDGRSWNEATAIANSAPDDSDRYLALLIRGGIAERHRTSADAIASYGDAHRLGPRFQTGCVGLSEALKADGQISRARQVATECLSLDTSDEDDPDPWWSFRAGLLDAPTTEWLKKVAWP